MCSSRRSRRGRKADRKKGRKKGGREGWNAGTVGEGKAKRDIVLRVPLKRLTHAF